MYLKSLEIAGFKSFAKKGELEFKSPITAIVGPNGSGKSNVAESFRFVLGEQSIKSMRGKKGEDLIFNGSNKIGKMNRAAVKVVFENSRRIMDIDFDEVIIERVVNRDGSNEYSINGSQVRLKDIHELLAGAHIGATGHHIISQGEADKILNSNIRERRAMIEDALGLKVYQYKRAESERKLEKTQENIKQVESLRRELAPHLKFLRKQVERVEKGRVMKEELKGLYREYFRREDLYIKNQQAFLEIEKRAPLAELAALDKQLTSAKQALIANSTEAGHGSGGKGAKRGSELVALEERIKAERITRDTLTRDLGRIEGEVSSIERSLKRLEQAAAIEENKTVYLRDVRELGDSIGAFIRDGEVLSDKSNASVSESDLEQIKSAFRKIRDAFAQFVSKNRHQSQSDEKQKNEYHGEISRLAGEKQEIEKKIASIKHIETELNSQYLHIKAEIEKEKEGSLEAEKAILKIMSRQNEINAEFASLKSIEEKLALEIADFKRELGEARMLIGREATDYAGLSTVGIHIQIDAQAVMSEARQIQLDRRRAIEKIKIRLEEFGAGSSEEIMKEFRDSEERDTFLAREIEDLERSAESLRTLIAELRQRLDIEFREGIRKINAQFQEFFVLMFGGGNASLEVVKEERRRKKSDIDSLSDALGDNPDMDEAYDDEAGERVDGDDSKAQEELPEGIDIHVTLPHKKTKGLVMLSGGERALTSIALLFAMSQVNPPPFIILDETDAALDEANSRKYGDMIENLSRYSQLILITHNRETMSRAGVLYGVTMGGDGVSKLLSIEFDEAVLVAK